jgi:HEAT repeat protein
MKRFFALTAPLMICTALMIPAKSQTPADNDRAKSLLAQALKAKNPDTRKEAVKALRLVAGSRPFGTRLEAMLNDKDVQVRLAAVEALAELKNGAALRTALDDKVAEVRFAAATALFKLSDPAGRAFLMGVLTGAEEISSGMIASVIAALRETVTDKDAQVRAAAVQALALVDDAGAATLFAGMFKDKNQGVRLRAAAGYLRLDNPAAVRTSDTEEE